MSPEQLRLTILIWCLDARDGDCDLEPCGGEAEPGDDDEASSPGFLAPDGEWRGHTVAAGLEAAEDEALAA